MKRFAKIGGYYINVERINHIEEFEHSDMLSICFGTHTDAGEEMTSIQLEGEDARQFRSFLDRHAENFDLTLDEVN